MRRLDGETVQRLIAQLPEQFREALVLREINDLSYREIAEVVGVPVGTVMSRLARARALLRDGLDWPRRRDARMTCEEAEVLLHALIDGELDAGHAREVEAHVAGCARCAAQLAAYRELQQALRRRQPALRRAGVAARKHRARAARSRPARDQPARAAEGLCAGRRRFGRGGRQRRASSSCAQDRDEPHPRRSDLGASALAAGRPSDRRASRATSTPSSRGSTASSTSRRR